MGKRGLSRFSATELGVRLGVRFGGAESIDS